MGALEQEGARPEQAGAGLLRLRPRLLRRARRYTSDRDEAEDLVQETLLRVWSRLNDDPPVDDVERYLFTTLRHLSKRRRQVDEALEDDVPGNPAPGTDRLAAAEVAQAMKALPGAQADLILEHAVEGASYRELANRHGLPIGTVMSRVARGRAGLIRMLDLEESRPVADLLGRRA